MGSKMESVTKHMNSPNATILKLKLVEQLNMVTTFNDIKCDVSSITRLSSWPPATNQTHCFTNYLGKLNIPTGFNFKYIC